jgi:hypothetical protein
VLARVKTQPRVQEITLPDRLDDRWSGAFEIQNDVPGGYRPANDPPCGKIFYEGLAEAAKDR